MSVMASHYNRGCPGSAADVPQCLASPAYQNSMSEGQDGDQQAAYAVGWLFSTPKESISPDRRASPGWMYVGHRAMNTHSFINTSLMDLSSLFRFLPLLCEPL